MTLALDGGTRSDDLTVVVDRRGDAFPAAERAEVSHLPALPDDGVGGADGPPRAEALRARQSAQVGDHPPLLARPCPACRPSRPHCHRRAHERGGYNQHDQHCDAHAAAAEPRVESPVDRRASNANIDDERAVRLFHDCTAGRTVRAREHRGRRPSSQPLPVLARPV